MSTASQLVELLPKLSEDQQARLLRQLDLATTARLRWLIQARPKQITPDQHFLCDDPLKCAEIIDEAWKMYPGEHIKAARKRLGYMTTRGHQPWFVWIILAGRGWGKTRTGAEDIAKYMIENPGVRVALVAATFQDGRDTMVEGDSGLRNIIPDPLEMTWNRSLGELILTNGSRAKVFSAEQPERLRGPQHHRAWCDELAAWEYRQRTWDMLLFGLRLGPEPQVLVTTTPKPYKIIRRIVEQSKEPREGVVLTTGHTNENRGNLSALALQKLEEAYANTRIGRQELAAEVLDQMEGGLIRLEYIDDRRLETWQVQAANDGYADIGEMFDRIVIGVDPAVTSDVTSNETGIVVVGKTRSPCPFCSREENPRGRSHAVVLEDVSGRFTDAEWTQLVARTYKKWKVDRIIAEKNNGGDLVQSVIHSAGVGLPVKLVWASRGKVKRAEPVAACYERREVHHYAGMGAANDFSKLEDQLLMLGIEDEEEDEPTVVDTEANDVGMDRADACVWALTELLVPEQEPLKILTVQDNRARATR